MRKKLLILMALAVLIVSAVMPMNVASLDEGHTDFATDLSFTGITVKTFNASGPTGVPSPVGWMHVLVASLNYSDGNNWSIAKAGHLLNITLNDGVSNFYWDVYTDPNGTAAIEFVPHSAAAPYTINVSYNETIYNANCAFEPYVAVEYDLRYQHPQVIPIGDFYHWELLIYDSSGYFMGFGAAGYINVTHYVYDAYNDTLVDTNVTIMSGYSLCTDGLFQINHTKYDFGYYYIKLKIELVSGGEIYDTVWEYHRFNVVPRYHPEHITFAQGMNDESYTFPGARFVGVDQTKSNASAVVNALGDRMPTGYILAKWNTTTDTYNSYISGVNSPGDAYDFNIYPGDAVWVQVNQTTTVILNLDTDYWWSGSVDITPVVQII